MGEGVKDGPRGVQVPGSFGYEERNKVVLGQGGEHYKVVLGQGGEHYRVVLG